MRSDVIVIAGIGPQDAPQMRLAQDDKMVQALAADRADQSFGKAILPGRAWRGRLISDAHGANSSSDDGAIDLIQISDAHGANSSSDDGAIDVIPISDEVARRLIPRKGFG